MKETDERPKRACDSSFRLWERDWQRFMAIRDMLERKWGRPASASKVIMYLLDIYDEAAIAELSNVGL